MTFDFFILKNAIQQGNWLLIPAILLAIGLCFCIIIGIPRLFKDPFQFVFPIRSWVDLLPERPRQFLMDFVGGSLVLLRWAAKFISTVLLLAGIILTSSSALNLLAGQEMISLIGNPDEDFTLLTGVVGGSLLVIGAFFTFWVRALSLGNDALRVFNFVISQIFGLLGLLAAIILFNLNSRGILMVPWPILVVGFILFPFLFFMGIRQLMGE
jgi:hypothetical protein